MIRKTVYREPLLLLDRSGRPIRRLTELIRPEPVTALVGAGGKTASMLALGGELAAMGHRAVFCATTRIWPPEGTFPPGLFFEGTTLPEGKMGPPEDFQALRRKYSFVLAEADGSHCLPAKAPAEWEPALPEDAGMVIAVQGTSAYGRPIGEVCHRAEIVCALLGKTPADPFLPEDGAFLLCSEQGQRKNVNGRPYAVILNQADTPARLAAALKVASLLPREIPVVISAYREE